MRNPVDHNQCTGLGTPNNKRALRASLRSSPQERRRKSTLTAVFTIRARKLGMSFQPSSERFHWQNFFLWLTIFALTKESE